MSVTYIITLNHENGEPRAYWQDLPKDFTILRREASVFADHEAALRAMDSATRVASNWADCGEVELREIVQPEPEQKPEPIEPEGHIDLTPTWSACLPILIEGIRSKNPESRGIAFAELRRMAGLADAHVAHIKEQQNG